MPFGGSNYSSRKKTLEHRPAKLLSGRGPSYCFGVTEVLTALCKAVLPIIVPSSQCARKVVAAAP